MLAARIGHEGHPRALDHRCQLPRRVQERADVGHRAARDHRAVRRRRRSRADRPGLVDADPAALGQPPGAPRITVVHQHLHVVGERPVPAPGHRAVVAPRRVALGLRPVAVDPRRRRRARRGLGVGHHPARHADRQPHRQARRRGRLVGGAALGRQPGAGVEVDVADERHRPRPRRLGQRELDPVAERRAVERHAIAPRRSAWCASRSRASSAAPRARASPRDSSAPTVTRTS